MILTLDLINLCHHHLCNLYLEWEIFIRIFNDKKKHRHASNTGQCERVYRRMQSEKIKTQLRKSSHVEEQLLRMKKRFNEFKNKLKLNVHFSIIYHKKFRKPFWCLNFSSEFIQLNINQFARTTLNFSVIKTTININTQKR